MLPSIWREPNENLSKRTGASLEGVLRALFGGDSGEGRPALLDSLTAAVRAQNLAFFVIHKRQNLVEEFLAFLAEEFVVGHADLQNFRRGYRTILDLGVGRIQSVRSR